MATSVAKTTGARARSKGWKRGARRGNYTPMQLNIACRVSKMGQDGGKAAYFSPASCPVVKQARISLGDLPRKSCATRWTRSICSEVGIDFPDFQKK